MERYEANEWESYVAGVEIDAFGQILKLGKSLSQNIIII